MWQVARNAPTTAIPRVGPTGARPPTGPSTAKTSGVTTSGVPVTPNPTAESVSRALLIPRLLANPRARSAWLATPRARVLTRVRATSVSAWLAIPTDRVLILDSAGAVSDSLA